MVCCPRESDIAGRIRQLIDRQGPLTYRQISDDLQLLCTQVRRIVNERPGDFLVDGKLVSPQEVGCA